MTSMAAPQESDAMIERLKRPLLATSRLASRIPANGSFSKVVSNLVSFHRVQESKEGIRGAKKAARGKSPGRREGGLGCWGLGVLGGWVLGLGGPFDQ